MAEDPFPAPPPVRGEEILRARVGGHGLRVHLWQREGSDHPDQDRWLATSHGQGLRVAAVDGVTPWRGPPAPGADAAQFAAATVAGALLLPMSAREALRFANNMLHRPEVTPSRRQAMAAVAVADCAADGSGVTAEVVVAADCEVWAADEHGTMTLAAGGDFLRPGVRSAWLRTRERLPADADVLAIEAATLDDPATQVRHAVGRYRDPVWSEAEVTGAALVVASDGCRLSEWAAAERPTVAGLGRWIESVAARPRRDDLTCLLVERA